MKPAHGGGGEGGSTCLCFVETVKSSSFKPVCSRMMVESRSDDSSVCCVLKHCFHMVINMFLSKDSMFLFTRRIMTGKTNPKRKKRCHEAPILGSSQGREKFRSS